LVLVFFDAPQRKAMYVLCALDELPVRHLGQFIEAQKYIENVISASCHFSKNAFSCRFAGFFFFLDDHALVFNTFSMNIFLRVARFLLPFKTLLTLSLIFGALFSLLTAISIAFVEPIFQVLFSQQRVSVLAADATVLERAKFQFYHAITEYVIQGSSRDVALMRLGAVIVMVFVAKNIVKYIGITVNTLLNERMMKSIRDEVFGKMLALSTDFFVGNKTGALVSLITNDVAAMHNSITPVTTTLVREPLQIIIFICALLAISPTLTLAAFSTSIVALLIIRVATKYLRAYAERMHHAMANYTAVLQEAISGIRIVKAFSMEARVHALFTRQTRDYARTAGKYQRAYDVVPAVSEVFAIVALAVVLFVGGREVFAGRMQSAELMNFLFMLFSVMSPITNLANLPGQMTRGMVAAETVFAVLDRVPSVQQGDKSVAGFASAIEVRDVTFAYIEKSVLRDVSFTLHKSRKIALVGASGSGKTTMCDLIIRLYDPQHGAIMLDGVNIKEFTFTSYRRLFGVVSQESVLFNDTVANNIRFGFPDATDEQLREAARIANAEEFIMKLPHGFETYIGDRGVMLSGGQKQRLAIARALVGNPAILVFDEATSALDSESEKLVQDAINHVLENRTALIIAHRLSTILSADEILVFDDGRIVERGTYTELLAQGGIFKKLYDIQFGMES
jgi:subfamily B ATP-binding cassette protein MsbA